MKRTYIRVTSFRPHTPPNLYSMPSTKEPIQGRTEHVAGIHEPSVAESVHATRFLWDRVPLGGDGRLFPKPRVPSVYGQDPSQLPVPLRGYRITRGAGFHQGYLAINSTSWATLGKICTNIHQLQSTYVFSY